MITEKAKLKLQEAYEKFMDKPRKVLEIFQDFYGEERVDLQGLPSFDQFLTTLGTNPIKRYIPPMGLTYNKVFDSLPKEEQDVIIFLKDTEDVLSSSLIAEDVLVDMFLPIIWDSIFLKEFDKGFILVHFPNVRVTNEHDRFVDITQLWAKIEIHRDGTGFGYFGLNRSEYTKLQFANEYMHSHMSSIPLSDFTYFGTPCTGNGPINATLSTLAISFDESIWQLFCLELDLFVRVESLSGGPYHKLETLVDSSNERIWHSFDYNTNNARNILIRVNSSHDYKTLIILKYFIEYLIKSNALSYNYVGGNYGIATSFSETIILISNSFISWYNNQIKIKQDGLPSIEDLLRDKIIVEGIMKDQKLHTFTNNNTDRVGTSYEGSKVCVFKGKDILLHIQSQEELGDTENKSIFLSPSIISVILASILRVLNCNYGREKEGTIETSSPKRYF